MSPCFSREIVLLGIILLRVPCTLATYMTPYEELMFLLDRAGHRVTPTGRRVEGYSKDLPAKRVVDKNAVCLQNIHKTMEASYSKSCSRVVIMQGQCVEPGSDEVPLLFNGNLHMKNSEMVDKAQVFFSCEDRGISSCHSAVVGEHFPDQLSNLLAHPGCRTSMSCTRGHQVPLMSLTIVDASCRP
ncbi:hypothetical protein CAPTEDRAFT_187587 [Capitella teleta]|uniref:Secreted protein n=1 Tax=Capitella teleta TaxID=283909 RepID=R7UK04_CAPTE|nr:hypothetical protein CAPTEDRAFT_187587 [Capitella teleta]|eukprot:ELU04128.1 hypothetical protein CAPTEDRAFT_187587 [Capitella teleta]